MKPIYILYVSPSSFNLGGLDGEEDNSYISIDPRSRVAILAK